MENQHKGDEFLRRLISNQGPEKAPDHFTDRIMAKIQANPAIDDSPLLSRGTWISIILAAAAVVIFIFAVDMPFIDRIFSSASIQQMSMNIFSRGFLDTMSAFFKGLNISGITVAIIIAATGLVVLERLLHKKFGAAKLLFI